MNPPPDRPQFERTQLNTVNEAVEMAEELVSNHFKMSASEWLRPKYDIKTLAQLEDVEVTNGPFAQIIRYEGKHQDAILGSGTYDYYKICLQDHTILNAIDQERDLQLFPFCLYIITHELIHIVRFSKFLQQFDASPAEKMVEEKRVHHKTHHILSPLNLPGIPEVLGFYSKWRMPLEGMQDPSFL